jgi:nicotinamide phosphoribosyltransferase
VDRNPILDTDSYKLSHYLGYPPDVTNVYSYAESRGGEYPDVAFFGTQSLIKDKLCARVTDAHAEEAEHFCTAHGLPFNLSGWRAVIDDHEGQLPIEVCALDEGTVVPVRTPLFTVENTDDRLPWLTSYVETLALRHLWYSTSVCTRVFHMKREIADLWDKTAEGGRENPGMAFALLDFSSRGCAGYEANELGGAAHLTHFMGSDSVPAIRYVNRLYGCDMAGFSVPASEHSIMCAWGKGLEEESFTYMLEHMVQPGGAPILSIVADTWNVFEAAEYFARLAPAAKRRGVTMVFRPDSGTPGEILPEVVPVIAAAYGSTVNSKGYHVLDGAKILWGDGINRHTHTAPLAEMIRLGFSVESIMTGSGGGLMQADLDRDTMKFAFKASAVKDSRGWRGIAKDPITDPGKVSKKGRFAVIRDGNGGLHTVQATAGKPYPGSLLLPRYRNGLILNDTTLDEVRDRFEEAL